MPAPTTDLEQATAEAYTYNQMGALTKEVLEDLAWDYEVEMEDILEELGWGKDYYG